MAQSITLSDKKFEFTSRERTISLILMVVGLIGIVAGFIYYGGTNPGRLWGNLLFNSFFFMGIAIASAFFIAAHYLGYGGWYVAFKRVPEAISMTIPINVVILALVIIFGHHYLYVWADTSNPAYDAVVKGKAPYFNWAFFSFRFIFFLGILVTLTIMMRRNSLREDSLQPFDRSIYKRQLTLASLFILFFAIYISVSAWDWLMSVDVHWFSTMYGWYTFASFWVTGISIIALFVIYLKSRGYLPWVNDSHIQDLGKFMFAFSIFWTYLTFCQYMLIWYANIPEETKYFKYRYEHYDVLFYGIFILNFVTPFLLLMTRRNKRNPNNMIAIALVIFVGHFIDFFQMVMPGTAHDNWGFGFLEVATPCFFIGLLLYVTFTSLTKAPLLAKNHPMLNESLHHHI